MSKRMLAVLLAAVLAVLLASPALAARLVDIETVPGWERLLTPSHDGDGYDLNFDFDALSDEDFLAIEPFLDRLDDPRYGVFVQFSISVGSAKAFINSFELSTFRSSLSNGLTRFSSGDSMGLVVHCSSSDIYTFSPDDAGYGLIHYSASRPEIYFYWSSDAVFEDAMPANSYLTHFSELVLRYDRGSPDIPSFSEPDIPPPIPETSFPEVGRVDNEYIPYDTTVWNQFSQWIKQSIGSSANIGFIGLAVLVGIYLIVRIVRMFTK